MLILESEEESPTARNAAYHPPAGVVVPPAAVVGTSMGPSDNSERTRSVRFNDAGYTRLTTTEEATTLDGATAAGVLNSSSREREEEGKSSRERRKEQGEGNGIEMV
jgi:hypothetical protein